MFFESVFFLFTLYIGILKFQKRTFRLLSFFCNPIVRLYIRKRIRLGLEDKKRYGERFGISSIKRPSGKLIWIHAVSVGEALSVIPVIKMFKRENVDLTILLTTTTLTAAKQVENRLKNEVIHQFAPFDIFTWILRFIEYWKPDIALFVESELWPNTLYYLQEKGVPTYLLNARISEKSLRWMSFAKKILRIFPFSLFTTVYVSSRELGDKIKNLGGERICIIPNLKTIAEKLPVNFDNVEKLSKKIKNRKSWIAVSSHPGEEEIITQVHKKLKEKYPDILTFIALRHPSRKREISELCEKTGLSHICHKEELDKNRVIIEDIYIIDEIGCLGEFFEMIDTVLVCGSLVPGIGGHNFLEPLN
ncbi:MAG: hypothetical protein LBI95_04220, partial [Holosporales bacterium]|nr:hypothetical protein [Holosporales bacterium]